MMVGELLIFILEAFRDGDFENRAFSLSSKTTESGEFLFAELALDCCSPYRIQRVPGKEHSHQAGLVRD